MTMDDCIFIEDEVYRINAGTAQGEQSIMIQSEMKRWGLANDMWPNSLYKDIIDTHAEARGWTQDGFTGMEVV